jgi:3-methyladenine DNA glycosylase AlkD
VFDPQVAADAVVAALRPLGDAERAAGEKRYLKSELDFLGIRLPDLRSVVVAASREHRELGRADVISWALALWDGPLWEQRCAAVELLRARVRDLIADDLGAVATLIRAAAGWALVDPLAGDVAGQIALAHPQGWRRIDLWALDDDFWIRRSALLSLLPGIRAGRPDLARFDQYARPMLGENEFFVRKAIGWVLREIAKSEPGYVTAWTDRHLHAMSGVTFREAVRRLPQADARRLSHRRSQLQPRDRGRLPHIIRGQPSTITAQPRARTQVGPQGRGVPRQPWRRSSLATSRAVWQRRSVTDTQ